MQLNALRYFAMVAATGSFIATARHFRVPASSVSRQIAALEREVGQQLLYRHTRAVRLTDAGERYYLTVREALDLLDMAAEQAADKDTQPRGLIRVNAPVALGRLHIAPLLNDLQKDYPDLSVQLTLTDAFIDPVQEGADITLRVGRLEDSGLVARLVAPQRYILCASRGYLDTHGVPDTPEQLVAHNCLVYRGQWGAQRWYFRQPGAPHYDAYDVTGRFQSNNAETLVSAAEASLGLVLFPTWLFQAGSFRKGRLVKLLTGWEASVEAEPPGIHLVSPENRSRSRKVRVVTDFLLERIGAPPYWDRV
ncbi:LysR family transcriptional regulator [Luteibacter rhizovicinus DSM 16549]|uniref:LysR family transcriptional regulator n=1 Tax=Luteibacter rhizovicinus DSM 16549 TaxID=1440763 RepID=A0A0G9H678_9GAMM|nr:LysR family transcriptional regulator [Luteibacter rhizovicinus]APG05512.1 LysR family transcriptional regulator [Luteibacter rhizovicinus DSM 16549]KLD65103.1 LysR family transcriptional regulator [Luteibacter rhizovicinus DSM 16549]KLD75072.1 LysR family transcriptional regulator [Xanthomonas hyacinthi DSM 19077]